MTGDVVVSVELLYIGTSDPVGLHNGRGPSWRPRLTNRGPRGPHTGAFGFPSGAPGLVQEITGGVSGTSHRTRGVISGLSSVLDGSKFLKDIQLSQLRPAHIPSRTHPGLASVFGHPGRVELLAHALQRGG